MRAGLLRHRGVVQSYTESQDSTGDAVQTWANFATRWMDISPSAATESFEAERSTPRITHTITMRYDATITNRMRVLHDSRYFYLIGMIDKDLRKIDMVWSASEGGEDG